MELKCRRGWLLSVLAGCLILFAAGCGSDDSDDPDGRAANGGEVAAGGEGRGQAENGEEVRQANRQARAEMREHRRQRTEAAEPTPEEREAKGQAQRFYDILGQDANAEDPDSTEIDSAAFCDLMSEEAIQQTIEYAERSSGIAQEWNCENSVELLVIRAKRTGGFDAASRGRVVGVNAEGDRATATVRFGRGPLSTIPLVREDGEWKLGSSPAAGD